MPVAVFQNFLMEHNYSLVELSMNQVNIMFYEGNAEWSIVWGI